MNRQKKYPDTKWFKFHNQNPRNRVTGDCAFRAISLATGKSYEECVMEMAALMCKTGFALNDTKGISKYMEQLGWVKNVQPKRADGTKYTGKQFCEVFKGTCVANIGGHHIVCITDGRIHDIWDSSNGCIGIYWTHN